MGSDPVGVELIKVINQLRQNPSSLIEHLKDMKKHFTGNIYRPQPNAVGLVTKEGVHAIDEAIQALSNTKPLGAFKNSNGLNLACLDHARDLNKNNLTGHTGTDGSSSSQRIERYGLWEESCGENIDFGSNDPLSIVSSLIIDDGVTSRGHRKNLLNPSFRVIGVAIGPHPTYKFTAVMDFAGGFTESSNGPPKSQSHNNSNYNNNNHNNNNNNPIQSKSTLTSVSSESKSSSKELKYVFSLASDLPSGLEEIFSFVPKSLASGFIQKINNVLTFNQAAKTGIHKLELKIIGSNSGGSISLIDKYESPPGTHRTETKSGNWGTS